MPAADHLLEPSHAQAYWLAWQVTERVSPALDQAWLCRFLLASALDTQHEERDFHCPFLDCVRNIYA